MDTLQSTGLTLGPFTATFLLGIASVVLLIWHSYKKQTYWKKIGISYVKPYPLIGSVLDNLLKPVHEVDFERSQKFGRIYGHYESNSPLLSVADPDLLRSIFVKDFHVFTGRRRLDTGEKITQKMISILRGEDWKRIRSIDSPTFTTGKIKRMMSIFKECSRTLMKNFKEAAEKGKPIETKEIYGAFAMDVIASSAFSTKIDSHNDPNNEFVTNAKTIFTKSFNWRILLFLLAPFLMKVFKISLFSQEKLDFFTKVTLQIVEERKKTGQKRNDFLQLLIDTTEELSEERKLDLNEKDDIMENYGKQENSDIFKSTANTKKGLSQEELIAQCIIFFIAGYDTTSSALSFVSYLLALHPEIQEKLIEELDDVLRENGELTYDAIQSMKYLDNVISESLRLYPPATRLERLAEEDFKLGDTGITIRKGMLVTVPVYALHRDPEFFPDPEKFDPDRFIPEERSKRNQFSYLPFGAGPRNCVGMRFVLVQMKVCLAYVLGNFRIKKCPETKVPLDFHMGPGTLQAKDVTLLMEMRNDAVKNL